MRANCSLYYTASKMAGKFRFLLVLTTCSFAYSLELKQVLVLSRHNLRTPLTGNVQTMSPKIWPTWNHAPGALTEKGALLEGYIGEYFSEWLKYQGLIKGCSDSVYIYANTRQRTKETAKAFADAAFRNCNIPVYSKNTTEMDPVFNPIIRNSTEAFKEQFISEMTEKLNETDLRAAFFELNRITNIKDSQICKEKSYCDLVNDKHDILFEVGKEPDVDGPLFIGNSVVDAFLMSYYEGFPMEDIAWGEIKTDEQWELLMKVVRDNQNVRYNLKKSAIDIAKPLLQQIKTIILRGNKKFTLLVGHDSNLNPVITALGFEPFTLPGQLEISPIGAKLVFQKWSDGVNDFLKVEYVYESWPQIRNAEKLSLLNPPKNITMYLKNLTHENGFYRWSDFERKLRDATEY